MGSAEARVESGGGFFYHLFRGSDLLEADKVAEACEELEHALALQPDNIEAISLRASCLYKLGRSEEAIDAYQQLLLSKPGEPTLYVNLALVYIKANRLDDAEAALRTAINSGGESKRLQGYLGLVYSKKTEYEKALIAFSKAGATKMIAEMEGFIKKRQQGLIQKSSPAPETVSAGETAIQKDMDQLAERSQAAAIDAAQRRRKLLRLAPEEEEKPEAASPAPVVSAVPAPAPTAPPPVAPPAPSPRVETSTARRVPLVRQGAAPLRLEGADLLRISLSAGAISTLGESAVLRGTFKADPVFKRFKGKTTKSHFGPPNAPLCKLEGEGELWLRAGTGKRLFLFETSAKETAFVAEQALYAFTGSLSWENGRIGGSDDANMDLVTLSGEGSFAVASSGDVAEIDVDEGDEGIVVAQRVLLGWFGKIVPRLITSPDPLPSSIGTMVRLKGSGRVVVGQV
ncbi:MAG: tetratricopeptide repeat protein [Bdellovibrionota bacterium]